MAKNISLVSCFVSLCSAALLAIACLSGGERAWAQPIPTERHAVVARVEEAKRANDAAQEALTPLEQSLVFLANFEQDDLMFGRAGSTLIVPLEGDHYREGKFGRGFFFEQYRHNLFPPATADVENDLTGFIAIAETKITTTKTAGGPCGETVLSISMPMKDAEVKTTPTPVLYNRHVDWLEHDVTLLASCYVKGMRNAQLTMKVSLLPAELPAPKPGEAAIERIPDTAEPIVTTLNGQWQRITCWVKSDARLTKRQAVVTISSGSPAAITVLADGFQLQQANCYSNRGFIPTTWIAGGQSRPATSVNIMHTDVLASYPAGEGTIAFWTRSAVARPEIAWFTFMNNYSTPTWGLDGYLAGFGRAIEDKHLYTANHVRGTDDGQWHHLAICWNAREGSLYRDGKFLAVIPRKNEDITNVLNGYKLRLGSNSEGQVANAVMDEFAIFNRRLSQEEIQQLFDAKTPLRATAGPCALIPGPRTTYFRDEDTSPIVVNLKSLTLPETTAEVDCLIGDVAASRQRVTITKGGAVVAIPFSPAQIKCGDYPCRLAVTMGDDDTAYAEFQITIVPALRSDHYLLSSWGGGVGSLEWLKMFHNIGLNCVDAQFNSADELNALGREGFRYNWHFNFGAPDYSPAHREIIAERTRAIATQLAPFPQWWGTIINSETGPGHLPSPETRGAWFDAWAEKELGFPLPQTGWNSVTQQYPSGCTFPVGEKPVPDGIYAIPPSAYKALKWWMNTGGTAWRINAVAAKEIGALRPENKTWTDPLMSAGMVDELQGGCSWAYSHEPQMIIREFEMGSAYMREHQKKGKEFYPTLGMDYVQGDWLTVTAPDGVKKRLAPTADDLIQQSWISIAGMPSDGLTFWLMDGWYHGLRNEKLPWEPNNPPFYAPPGSDIALGKALKTELLPLGTMLKHVPTAQRPLALLLPESTLWFTAKEGNWNWGVVHFTNDWTRWVAESGIPYDIVMDANITPGALGKYKVIVFPMGQYISKTVYDELVAAANGGTKIIVDAYARQSYPNMERWDQKYFHFLPANERDNYGQDTRRRLAELRTSLLPVMDAHAVGADGPVLTFVRESEGIKYVSVINDHRQDGPYTEWTKRAEFKPYGKAQQATVYVRAPQGSILYEFTTSRKISTRYQDGHLVAAIDLPPHAGRLLCVYPAEFATLDIKVANEYERGQPTHLTVTLKDTRGTIVAGRQLLDVTITDPAGKTHDESGFYRMENGSAAIPFRPAVNDLPGEWQLILTERSSGLKTTHLITVR